MYGVEKITVTEDVALITFEKIPSNSKLTSMIFNKFAEYKINLDMISQTAPYANYSTISFTAPSSDLGLILKLTSELKQINSSLKPLVSSSNTKISLFGAEMCKMHGVAAKAFTAVANAINEISLITTSEIDISILVSNENFEEAYKALKAEFNI